MFKLNNKGMTTIEILVSFILVAAISATIYTTVSNYNNKRTRESNKLEISTYKNLLTKDIQDDLIKNGLINSKKREFKDGNTDVYIADMELKDRTTRRIVIKRQLADDYYLEPGLSLSDLKDYDDYFTIFYGTPTDDINSANYVNGLTEYPIPDFGFGYNHMTNAPAGATKHKVKDFRLVNVVLQADDSILSIFIGFQHVDLGSEYAINIVCPVNYAS